MIIRKYFPSRKLSESKKFLKKKKLIYKNRFIISTEYNEYDSERTETYQNKNLKRYDAMWNERKIYK